MYEPRPFTLKALRLFLPGVALVCLIYLFMDDPLKRLGLTIALAFAAGSGLYLDVFAGRAWVHLYEDYLAFQGPMSHYLESSFGWRISRTRIPYQRITALGRAAAEQGTSLPDGKGFFFVVHRRRGWRRRKFFIPCKGSEQYRDLLAELLKRVPQDCTLYTWKPFGRRGPF